MKRLALIAAIAFTAPAAAQEEPATPASVVAAAAPEEWAAIAPDDLLVMELAPDAAGRPRRVVIQLLPPPFSQPWVENIRQLAAAHWWDGTGVYRVVDNWVAQWGGGEGEDAGFARRPLPEGMVSPPGKAAPERTAQNRFAPPYGGQATTPYSVVIQGPDDWSPLSQWMQLTHPLALGEQASPFADPYARYYHFIGGFPIAMRRVNLSGLPSPYPEAWPIHCYASVGVARDLAPDNGTGAELYAVIGHAPRQLDRNIAVIGRVIAGIEHLSALPRGSGEAGVYEARAQDTPILSVRLASELPDPPRFEYLSSQSASFARYVAVRANRQDSFYAVPAGGVDICNVQVPVREIGR